jgi:hypothetical protein
MTIEVVHADSLEWIRDQNPDNWACLITDPPYGMSYRSRKWGKHSARGVVGDSNTAARDAVLAWWGDRPAAVFGTWKVARVPGAKEVCIWEKRLHGMGNLKMPWSGGWEEIAIYGDGWAVPPGGRRRSAVLSFPVKYRGDEVHPTEKPVALLRHLVERAPPGPILDPFAGSGSIAIACADLGRWCTVVEVEADYVCLIKQRVRDNARQAKLFA